MKSFPKRRKIRDLRFSRKANVGIRKFHEYQKRIGVSSGGRTIISEREARRTKEEQAGNVCMGLEEIFVTLVKGGGGI